eukprot:TRINITY_DN9377_c0_g1_i1.p1 TRINITY_DN9377_c0_g1~~TRINITY_DN9377_c0_g1_i1.p1  ORF type:complete len:219 (-),score=23.95 TRINITY_DN9377_c0_g1_i1:518-1174(-)
MICQRLMYDPKSLCFFGATNSVLNKISSSNEVWELAFFYRWKKDIWETEWKDPSQKPEGWKNCFKEQSIFFAKFKLKLPRNLLSQKGRLLAGDTFLDLLGQDIKEAEVFVKDWVQRLAFLHTRVTNKRPKTESFKCLFNMELSINFVYSVVLSEAKLNTESILLHHSLFNGALEQLKSEHFCSNERLKELIVIAAVFKIPLSKNMAKTLTEICNSLIA